MNKISAIVLFLLVSFIGLSQDKTAEELEVLSAKNDYETILRKYASKHKDYSARSLYLVGLAYYMTEDDQNCLIFMDLSIGKDQKDPAPYYIKASTLNYMQNYPEAVKNFQSAISLKSDDPIFYSGLGDSYYNMKKADLALEAYQKATEQVMCAARPYMMIAQIWSEKKDNDKALEAYYVAKSKIGNNSVSHLNALYNIGLIESLKGNYDSAETAFLELLKFDSDDYQTYAKLLQVYYHNKDYNKAKVYKDKLYEAHSKALLPDNLKDMFCFDQFKWKDYSVQVFERYQSGTSEKIYNKHIFYVLDAKEEIVFQAQTEFSPISLELGGAKYLLCAYKGTTHFNPGIGFNDDFEYEELKAAAQTLMEKHVK